MGLDELGNSAGISFTLSRVSHLRGNTQQATTVHFDDGWCCIRIHKFIPLNT